MPIFPPFQSIEDFTEAEVARIIRSGMKLPSEAKIEVHSVRAWKMQAQVAQSLSDPRLRCFLLGDAAHRFPPSGGFGMNTGLADAHNLCWKIAAVLGGRCDRSLLRSYHQERHPAAWASTRLSLENYRKTVESAAKVPRSFLVSRWCELELHQLGVDPRLARTLVNALENGLVSGIPLSGRKSLVIASLKAGLWTLRYLSSPHWLGDPRVRSLRRQVAAGDSLGLVFPSHDFEFVYGDGVFNQDENSVGQIQTGKRLPHIWFAVTMRGQELILSSVELCCGFSSGDDSRGTPLIVALVDSVEKPAWELARRKLGTSGALVQLVTVQSPQTVADHGLLQKLYQIPHYAIGNSDFVSKTQPHLYPRHFVRFDSERISTIEVDTVTDVSGRFEQLMNHGGRRKGAVLLRPDGHVLSVQMDSAPEKTLADALTALNVT